MAIKKKETIPCKWCGTQTDFLGTKCCHGCWELSSRIESEPELAQRILDAHNSKGEQAHA